MSGFYDDEASPWVSQSDERLSTAFDAPEPSPWAVTAHNGSPLDEDNPYDSEPIASQLQETPLVDQSSDHPEELYSEVAKDEVVEPKTRSKASKKKRGGGIEKESVDSDPLAASTINLDNIALNPCSDSSPPSIPAHAATSVRPLSESQLAGTPGTPASEHRRVPYQFEIEVSDPVTSGDTMNAYTEYTVKLSTNCESYKVQDSAVQRRYRDFRWLYRTLARNHVGAVIPAIPDKQALGRFNENFVQQRRMALETMLRKICGHYLLFQDPDLIAFMTSTDFSEYLKNREMNDEELQESTSQFFSAENSTHSNGGGSGSGFIGTLSGALSLSRGTEVDPWTVAKRKSLDVLETHLRDISRELSSISMYRKQLSDSLGDLSSIIKALSDVQATQRLSKVLRSFSKVHDRLAALHSRQRQQNMLTLEATLDEHRRTVSSIRDAINARQRIFSEAESANAEYEKLKAALDKLNRQGRTQEDRQKALEDDMEHMSAKSKQLHDKARDVALLVESEISRVTDEKIKEFRNAVELYLEVTIEAQKESIEIWETFYSRNFAVPKNA